MTVHRIVPLIPPENFWKNVPVPEASSLNACPVDWIIVPVAFPTPWLNVPKPSNPSCYFQDQCVSCLIIYRLLPHG